MNECHAIIHLFINQGTRDANLFCNKITRLLEENIVPPVFVSLTCFGYIYRLAGLVVKASASGAEDLGFESRLRQDFSGSSDTSDLKIGSPVATLPGAWYYRVNTGTGWPSVSIL